MSARVTAAPSALNVLLIDREFFGIYVHFQISTPHSYSTHTAKKLASCDFPHALPRDLCEISHITFSQIRDGAMLSTIRQIDPTQDSATVSSLQKRSVFR